MSNINKQALREATQEATGAHDRLSVMPADDIFDISQHEGTQLDADITALNSFNSAANPATVLALLDELEAAEKRIAELETREVKMPDVEKWRSPVAVRAQNAYRVLVGQELSAAGIITKVGE